MITKEEYDKITATWPKGLRVYQSWKRLKKRLPFIEKELMPFLMDCTVLELGCNGGFHAMAMINGGFVKSYTGVDMLDDYIREANKTRGFMWDKVPVDFVRSSFGDYLKSPTISSFDAFYASFVLYHLNDEEVELLEKVVLPKCKVAVIPTRVQTRVRKKNSHALWEPKQVKKMLKRAGMKVQILWPKEDKEFCGIVGIRENPAHVEEYWGVAGDNPLPEGEKDDNQAGVRSDSSEVAQEREGVSVLEEDRGEAPLLRDVSFTTSEGDESTGDRL